MPRNVEIKARVGELQKLLDLASKISKSEPRILEQYDTFFNSQSGRLKLRRVVENGLPRSELIWYDRPDVAGPKLSDFKKIEVPEQIVEELKSILELTTGIKGEVIKQRRLFMIGQTRVHIDEVKDLGNFMELEVCLRDDQSIEEGQDIADKLQEALEVPNNQLLTGAYMDMLLKE